MKITCSQMDVLISFYLEGELSNSLKEKVEEHLTQCTTCKTKYEILKTLIYEINESYKPLSENNNKANMSNMFHNNVSAYIDNELSQNESLKIKKIAISNKKARQILQDNYKIRKLMNESFNKTKFDTKQDFSKKVLKQLNPQEEYNLNFNPILKIGIGFVLSVLIISAIIIYSLTL